MSQRKDIASNKKARHEFHILETFEAGIELRGTEVKSIRAGRINLRDSFARIDKSQIWLHGCDIQMYERASYEQHEAKRPRRLLLHKKEILKLYGYTAEKGLTLIALRAYWKEQLVKIEIGVARGKMQADKREDIKKRDQDREARRAMTSFNRR